MAGPRIYLAHGASGSAASMQPHVRGLAARGIDAASVQLPRTKAERAVAAYRDAAPPSPATVIGGHSYGGRVASLLAAEEPYAGLVLLSYPLHSPGRGERWDERTAHWPSVLCPVLLLSGDRDQFARVDLLRSAVERLPHAELVVYPGLRHGIGPVLDDALDRIATWLEGIAPAAG